MAQPRGKQAAAAKASAFAGGMQVVTLPSKSPLVTFRFVFLTGAADDPSGKPGLAYLTAGMLAEGGTAKMTYEQIVDSLFPMATQVNHQVDKEMTTFSRSLISIIWTPSTPFSAQRFSNRAGVPRTTSAFATIRSMRCA